MIPALLVAAALGAPDLRLDIVRESITGTHYRYRQFIAGVPVAGGEVNVTVRRDGERVVTSDVAARPSSAQSSAISPAVPAAFDSYVNMNGVARPARRVIDETAPLRRVVRYLDIETNAVIREEPLFALGRPARVFEQNPVVKLNAPQLQDQNNASSAVPDSAYTIVDLADLHQAGPLGGPFAQITDIENPAVTPIDAGASLLLDRSQTGFEDVNAYFQVDHSQRYLQSLGFTGPRAVAAYAIPIDTHAAGGNDSSFFVSAAQTGEGMLFFGDGGTDDAEDADLVVHEYGHAIHDWIAPGTFLGPYGSQGRAISEGFGDYWAFSSKYLQAITSGRDPFCFADWDARCGADTPDQHCSYPPGANCLRRLDSAKTFADFQPVENAGTEHRNGEIWSSALREIFVAMTQRHGIVLGKRAIDTIVIESFFGTAPNPSFASLARKMITIDQILNQSGNADLICAAMTRRGILTDCTIAPRGELTWFQSSERGVAVADNDISGVVLTTVVSDPRRIARLYVAVDIEHPVRGDLRIVLTAPDGTSVLLQNTSLDRGPDIRAIYGRDSLPAESLDVFLGRPAAGEWKLRVSDLRSRDAGTVRSWSLIIQFEGDEPAQTRPIVSGTRQIIAAAAHAPGANGTYFTTDVRLLNRQARDVTATITFTSSASDGRSQFASIKTIIPPQHIAAFDDILAAALQSTGTGQIEIDGDVVVTSRTYTTTGAGTYGQFIGPFNEIEAIGDGAFVEIPQLQNDERYRSNIGIAEVAGAGGNVRVVIYSASDGTLLSSNDYSIAPHSHLQVPVNPAGGKLTGEIRVIGGGARIVGYGSVIDNRSGDPIFIPAGTLPETRTVSAPVISAPGANGTLWRSDVWITGVPDTDAVGGLALTFIDAMTHAESKITLATPSGRRAIKLEDIVRNAFGREGRGILTIELPPGVLASSRTYTENDRGTFGQFVPFRANRAGNSADILHVESSAAYRTNIGVYSTEPSQVHVTLLDSSGAVLEEREVTIDPFQQFTAGRSVTNGRIRVDVTSGHVESYGSTIDNRTGDPIFVPAQ